MFGDANTRALNSLIATTLDSVDGYRKAAEEAGNHQFAEMFRTRANEREALVREMQTQVRALGGNPEDDGTILASAHRAFLGLRDAITGKRDDTAIIAEVERGEDHIKAKFDAAMNDDDLTGDARMVVSRAYESVRAGHDQMSALKHNLGAH